MNEFDLRKYIAENKIQEDEDSSESLRAENLWKGMKKEEKIFLFKELDEIDDFWIKISNGKFKPNKEYLDKIASMDYNDLDPKYKNIVKDWMYHSS